MNFEITFLVDNLSDDAIDDLYGKLDCLAGTHHNGQDFVTVTCEGPDAVYAAKSMATQLAAAFGLVVNRVEADLVDRQEIARRLDVTRQAVAQWIRGVRGDFTFPTSFTDAAGGLWLWGDVVSWLQETGRPVRPHELKQPTRDEIDLINGFLVSGCQTLTWSPASAFHFGPMFTATLPTRFTATHVRFEGVGVTRHLVPARDIMQYVGPERWVDPQ